MLRFPTVGRQEGPSTERDCGLKHRSPTQAEGHKHKSNLSQDQGGSAPEMWASELSAPWGRGQDVNSH